MCSNPELCLWAGGNQPVYLQRIFFFSCVIMPYRSSPYIPIFTRRQFATCKPSSPALDPIRSCQSLIETYVYSLSAHTHTHMPGPFRLLCRCFKFEFLPFELNCFCWLHGVRLSLYFATRYRAQTMWVKKAVGKWFLCFKMILQVLHKID